MIKQWDTYELSFEYQCNGNPFTEVELYGIFRINSVVRKVYGFYAGNNIFKIRFAPDIIGEWSVETVSNAEALTGKRETFICEKQTNASQMPVRVSNKYHFAYADGTPYYPFGTTCYTWHYQTQEMQDKTIASLKDSPFNKIRMLLFPTNNDNNVDENQSLPFEASRSSANGKLEIDFDRFNPLFFDHLEAQITALAQLDIQADLILFHPYETWGFNSMSEEGDLRYIRYVVARLASFSNIWWSLANEYDLLENKDMNRWDTIGCFLQQEDPSGHLISIHNWHKVPLYYDNTLNWYPHQKPWITHLSIQYDRMFQIPKWLKEYNKPIVNDECRYEGNISQPWGNLTPQAMTKQFWEGVCLGGYVGHGETYANEDNYNWVSHGGVLLGDSISRIAFLRKIVEENDLQLQPFDYLNDWDCCKGIADNGKLLIYLGLDNQPCTKLFGSLEKGKKYSVQIIDTWEMKIEQIPEIVDNQTPIPLPEKSGLAVLLTEV